MMRMLTDYEVSLVAGGTSSSDYYPNGSGGPFGDGSGYGNGQGGGTGGTLWGFYTFINDSSGPSGIGPNGEIIVTGSGHWGFTPFGGQDGSGMGGNGMTDFAQALAQECAVDMQTDDRAMEIENLIKSQPDWHSREYAATIYMSPDGQVHSTQLSRGQTVAEALALGLSAPQTPVPMPPAGSIILAVIHSHPDVGYTSSEDIDNRYPSDYSGGGDYWTFDQLVGQNNQFANNAEFAQYILGPDGILREYNFSDGHVNSSNDQNQSSHSDLSSDRPCG